MISSSDPRRFLHRAVVASVALHAVAAALIVWPQPPSDPRRLGEPITVSHLTRITITTPRKRPASRQPSAVRAVASGTRTRVPHLSPAVVAPRQRGAALEPKAASLSTHARAVVGHTNRPAAPAPAIAALRPAEPTAAPAADVLPASPAPSEAPAAAGARGPLGSAGPWGGNHEALLDDNLALLDVRARIRGKFFIRVDVDDEGRATKVTFVSPDLDADVKAEVERRLRAARYVAAERNGVTTEGKVEIKS